MDARSRRNSKNTFKGSQITISDKPVHIAFIDEKLESSFEELEEGKFEDKTLHKFIERAIRDIKENPLCGIKIPKKLWPKIYIQNYGVSNLWKYDLPNAWRLIYTIKTDEVMILNVILEWFNHKDYEKRFKY